MNPDSLARSLCARHGLSEAYAEHLVPLVRKCLQAPDAVRDRILQIVDANLARVADGRASPDSVWLDLDHEVLVAVARVIHDWSPSMQMLDFGTLMDRLGQSPAEQDPEPGSETS